MTIFETRKYKAYTKRDIDRIPQLRVLSDEQRLEMKALSEVFPFRVNNYVVEELIDWKRVPRDPMYQLTFPQRGMLDDAGLNRMKDMIRRDAPAADIKKAAREIQYTLNPHPAGQMQLNMPKKDDDEVLEGSQHKYRETLLFFPSQGQTCHAYCTYCFRWAQFVGLDDMKFASKEADALHKYVRDNECVQSVLFTGGDPMIMRTKTLAAYIEPLLEIEHLTSIRIGTKAPAYWPYRFVTENDADELMALFEKVNASGKTLALMAHYSHPAELDTQIAEEALRRIRDTGAVIRCQAPLVKHVNDDPDVWADMWQREVRLGAVPYYMFVERDTGAKNYFEVPLAEAYDIFREAYAQCSGLERTVRGPSMSATPGKVCVQGTATIHGEKVFTLAFIQGRNPDWAGRTFFAKYDPKATWLDQLVPAFGEKEFFFEPEMRAMKERGGVPPWRLEDDEPQAVGGSR